MSYLGVDCAVPVKLDGAHRLTENGVSFVGRYLVPESMWKALTASEAKILRDAGLAILLCYELDADRVKGGANDGATDGKRARDLAKAMGIPHGTAIYFAVDYAPSESEYSTIERYFRAAKAACSPYAVGIYGSYYVVEEMKKRIPDLYVWQCVAWSGGKVSPVRNVYQYQWSGGPDSTAMQEKVGFAVDLNSCDDLAGAALWLPKYEENKPWYADDMAWAEERGYIRDGRPNDPLTRAELATVLHRVLGD